MNLVLISLQICVDEKSTSILVLLCINKTLKLRGQIYHFYQRVRNILNSND
jgi:hypothetical protein